MLQETVDMLPDSKQRLERACAELSSFIQKVSNLPLIYSISLILFQNGLSFTDQETVARDPYITVANSILSRHQMHSEAVLVLEEY